MAAATEETFARVGQMGLPLFVGLRGMDIPGLGPVKVENDIHTIRANKMLDINPDTVEELSKII